MENRLLPVAYFHMANLSDSVQITVKIKNKRRLDCIKYIGSDYDGLNPFMNNKGMLYLNLGSPKEYCVAHNKRRTKIGLTANSLNFTSIYIESHHIGYGYPNSKATVGLNENTRENPVPEDYRQDLFIFCSLEGLLNLTGAAEVHILVFKNQKSYATEICQMVIDGEYDKVLEGYQNDSLVFYDYVKNEAVYSKLQSRTDYDSKGIEDV